MNHSSLAPILGVVVGLASGCLSAVQPIPAGSGGDSSTSGGSSNTSGGPAGGPSMAGSGPGAGGSMTGSSGATGIPGSGGASGAPSAGGTPGFGGAAGATPGAGGAAGNGPAGGAAGAPNLVDLFRPLNGFEYLLPCGANQSYSVLVCVNPAGACPAGTEYLTAGTLNTNIKMTAPGVVGVTYMVTLHVQGVVEPKHYVNGANHYGTAQEGFYDGRSGTPGAGCSTVTPTTNRCAYPSTSGNYNVYMLQVGASDTTGQRYFWNAVNQTEGHFSYIIDYTVTIPIKGGDQLWFLAADSNCSAIRNCASTSLEGIGAAGRCDFLNINGLNPAPGAPIANNYNGQFIVLHVTNVAQM